MSLTIEAKFPAGKYSNETPAAQEKRKLFLKFVRNVVKEVDLNVYTIWLIPM